jgi:hypothetical protein
MAELDEDYSLNRSDNNIVSTAEISAEDQQDSPLQELPLKTQKLRQKCIIQSRSNSQQIFI